MNPFAEQLFVRLWNWLASPKKPATSPGGLDLGFLVTDGRVTKTHTGLAQAKRTEHVVVLGKTGSGKSSLLRYMAAQDIEQGRGFVFFDLHGDATPILLRLIAAKERATGADLSSKVIVIEPGDPDFSVGLNVLEGGNVRNKFVLISEFVATLKQHWKIDRLGARTEELLFNTFYVLADSGNTILEVQRFLTNQVFRDICLSKCENPEVKEYFSTRYDRASEAMQGVYRDAILNKVTAFTADPHFRHILGQQKSTFSLVEGIDQACWTFFVFDKARLGEQAVALLGLVLTKLKNVLFSRRGRSIFTIYGDELQNLAAIDSGIDVLFSELRKFGISICSANQFTDQYSPQIRAAIMAVGTHILFQLSSSDADKLAAALDGGRSMAELLKNLPRRHMVIKSGHHRPVHALVPLLAEPRGNYTDLYNRSRARWARRRTDIEREIRNRATASEDTPKEPLDGWE